MPKLPRNNIKARRIRLRGHQITTASVAIGAGILASGGVSAQAVDDEYQVINRQVTQPLGDPLENDVYQGSPIFQAINDADSLGKYENLDSEVVFFSGLKTTDGCGAPEDSFVYEVRDPDDSFARTNATVTVTLLPPVAVDSYQVNAGGVLTGNVQDNDPIPPDPIPPNLDPTPNALDVSFTSATLNGSLVQTHPSETNRTGEFEYTPNPGFSGLDSFEYVAGGQGEICTWNSNVEILVLPVATSDTRSIQGGTEVCGIEVLSNDLGSGLSLAGVTQPDVGMVSESGDGTLCFDPGSSFKGIASFSYQLQDSFGSRVTGNVQIEVGNQAPVLIDDGFQTQAGQPVTGNVLSNDSDPNGDELTVSSYGVASNGTVVGQPDGSFTYTPADGFSGSDSFQYTVTDTADASSVGTASVVVLPVASDNQFFEPQDGRKFRGNLLSNDSGTGLSVVANTDPDVGELRIQADGSFEYTPPPRFSGSVSFQYTVEDAAGNRSTATVTLGGISAIPVPVGGGGALGFLAVLLGWLGLRRLR